MWRDGYEDGSLAKPEECMALNFLKGDFIYRAWMEKEEEEREGISWKSHTSYKPHCQTWLPGHMQLQRKLGHVGVFSSCGNSAKGYGSAFKERGEKSYLCLSSN